MLCRPPSGELPCLPLNSFQTKITKITGWRRSVHHLLSSDKKVFSKLPEIKFFLVSWFPGPPPGLLSWVAGTHPVSIWNPGWVPLSFWCWRTGYFYTPPCQSAEFNPLGCLITIWDETHDSFVICELADHICGVSGCAVTGIEGV